MLLRLPRIFSLIYRSLN